jgi:hypothetical protein
LGVEITPAKGQSRLRVFIDYDLPVGWTTHWIEYLLGGIYGSCQPLSGDTLGTG